MVERALILPPEGGIGPISAEERQTIIQKSPMQRLYGQELDRESAYEMLAAHTEQRMREEAAAASEAARLKEENAMRKAQLEAERLARAEAREERLREKEQRQREKQERGLWGDILGAATKSTARTITNTIGREIGKSILRGVLGSLFGKR